MVRYWKARKTGIDVYSGGDITVASGGTLTVAGTFAYTHVGVMEFDNAVNVVGAFSVNTSSFTVAAATGNTAILGSLTIGAGAGTIVDGAGSDLIITETNIHLVGIVGLTGATTVTGAFAVTGTTTLTGNGTDPDLVLHGAGSLATEGRTASGTHVADGGTFAFVADQKSMRINVEGTVYQIPLWADT